MSTDNNDDYVTAITEMTPEQLASMAQELGLKPEDLVAPPRKDFLHGKGYHLKVKAATFKKSALGQEQVDLKVVALDADGEENKRATGIIFLQFPWETEGFKFRDIDARSRAMNDFKTLLSIAKPDLRLVRTVAAGDLKAYYDAKSGLKLESGQVAAAFKNEQIQVSVFGRRMQQSKDVSVFVDMTFFAVFNVWKGTGSLEGKASRRFQRFTSSPISTVAYLLDPKQMLGYPEGTAQSPVGDEPEDVLG